MDEALARKLLRNVRILNGFIIFFSVILISVFAITGVIAYKVLTEVRNAKDSVTSLQTTAEDSLDFKSQLCDSSSGSLKTLLQSQSDICN